MEIKVNVNLSPEQIAEAFCNLIDHQQARVFIEIARIASTWPGAPTMQWYHVGKCLKTCEPPALDARLMIEYIANAIED